MKRRRITFHSLKLIPLLESCSHSKKQEFFSFMGVNYLPKNTIKVAHQGSQTPSCSFKIFCRECNNNRRKRKYESQTRYPWITIDSIIQYVWQSQERQRRSDVETKTNNKKMMKRHLSFRNKHRATQKQITYDKTRSKFFCISLDISLDISLENKVLLIWFSNVKFREEATRKEDESRMEWAKAEKQVR